MDHSYTLSHLTSLTEPHEKFSSASHVRCRRQKAETKICCDDDKMVTTVDIYIAMLDVLDGFVDSPDDNTRLMLVLLYAFTYTF